MANLVATKVVESLDGLDGIVAAIPALSDEDVTRIAVAVNDEEAKRLAQ